MSEGIHKFIEDNIELIETDQFDKLYNLVGSRVDELTEILLKADINPFNYLKKIPGNSINIGYEIKEVVIPPFIDATGVSARIYGSDTKLILEQELKVIPSKFLTGRVDTLVLPNTKELEKIELNAFKWLQVRKVILSKEIDRSKLLVNKHNKDEYLKLIELR